jgi:uncharacterized RDD family membrane protein YckC
MRFFNRISLSTPESVELDFTLAGIGSRTLALVIDYSLLILVILAFWLVWFTFSAGLLSYLEAAGGNYSAVPWWLLAIFVLLNFVLWSGYFILFETIWQGQTPGKRMTHIRVVRDNGRPIRVTQATLRSILRPIDDFFFIGALFILFGRREKRIGDWAAGTIVIQEERGDRPSSILLAEDSQKLAARLPAIAELNRLIPDDFVIIREYLLRRKALSPKARTAKSMELARQLQQLIKLETIPPGTTSDHFLEAVYLAYQQFNGREEPR